MYTWVWRSNFDERASRLRTEEGSRSLACSSREQSLQRPTLQHTLSIFRLPCNGFRCEARYPNAIMQHYSSIWTLCMRSTNHIRGHQTGNALSSMECPSSQLGEVLLCCVCQKSLGLEADRLIAIQYNLLGILQAQRLASRTYAAGRVRHG